MPELLADVRNRRAGLQQQAGERVPTIVDAHLAKFGLLKHAAEDVSDVAFIQRRALERQRTLAVRGEAVRLWWIVQPGTI